LREKEFGVLDRLTRLGIEQQFPEHAQMRARIGSSITVHPAAKAGAT